MREHFKKHRIVGILKSIADEVVTFNDVTKNGVNWKNLTKNAADTIELFASAAMLGGATGGKKGAAKAVGIAAVIQGIADSVMAHKDMFNTGLDWKNLTLNAKGSLEIIGGMAGLGYSVGGSVFSLFLYFSFVMLSMQFTSTLLIKYIYSLCLLLPY